MKNLTLVLPFLIIVLVQSVIALPVQTLNAANELVYNVETGGIQGNQLFDTGGTNTCFTDKERCMTDVQNLVNVDGVIPFSITPGMGKFIFATGGGNGGRFGAATPHTLTYDIEFKKKTYVDMSTNKKVYLPHVVDSSGSSTCNNNWSLCAQVMSVETGLECYLGPWHDGVFCEHVENRTSFGQTLQTQKSSNKSDIETWLLSPYVYLVFSTNLYSRAEYALNFEHLTPIEELVSSMGSLNSYYGHV
eukprot:Nk52_evm1s1892 gene=Nk52_evmTU1s1892